MQQYPHFALLDPCNVKRLQDWDQYNAELTSAFSATIEQFLKKRCLEGDSFGPPYCREKPFSVRTNGCVSVSEQGLLGQARHDPVHCTDITTGKPLR